MAGVIKSIEEIAKMNPGTVDPYGYTLKKMEVNKVEPIKTIDGEPIEELGKRVNAPKKFDIDPEDELEFLKQEDKLLTARLDNKDLRDGKRPPSRVGFWSMVGLGLTALVGILKLLGFL